MEKSVLIVEDDPKWCQILEERLSEANMLTITSTTPEEATDQIRGGLKYNVALVDLANYRSRYTGLDVLNLSKTTYPSVPVVIISTARGPFPFGDGSYCKLDGVGNIGKLVEIVRRLTIKEVKR